VGGVGLASGAEAMQVVYLNFVAPETAFGKPAAAADAFFVAVLVADEDFFSAAFRVVRLVKVSSPLEPRVVRNAHSGGFVGADFGASFLDALGLGFCDQLFAFDAGGPAPRSGSFAGVEVFERLCFAASGAVFTSRGAAHWYTISVRGTMPGNVMQCPGRVAN